MLKTFQNPKNCNYLKSLLIILKNYFKKNYDMFHMSYNITTLNWKWKKMLFSISSKYSYFMPVFNYTKKKL